MRVIVYPSSDNPYLDLLFKKIAQEKVNFQYFNGSLVAKHPIIFGVTTFIPRLILKTLFWRITDSNLVFHLHWPVFSFGIPQSVFLNISFYHSLLSIFLIKALGYKLIWTVHNLTPHEIATSDDLSILKYLCQSTDSIIVHTKITQKKIEELLPSNQHNKVRLIQLGNYLEVYPNNKNRLESRQFLRLPEKRKVLLFFGEIKEYKGIDVLLEAHKKILQSRGKVNLVISGRVWLEALKKAILRHQMEFPDLVTVNFEYVPNEDVQYYFNASDLAVFPFNKITTSSSLLVSYSFSKPTVIPNLPELSDIPDSITYRFKPKSSISLANEILIALGNKNEIVQKSRSAHEYAKKFNWTDIAKKTIDLYQN